MSDHSESTKYERRLVAIMFTDIVGYTAMMEKDEHVAVDTIERHRQVLEKYTKIHQGEILQYYGDGSLSIFPSAIEAVECAIKVQKELTDHRLPLRIGIHLGDVKIKGDAIFGDGVNVASRIQALGIAGSIIISDTIFHLIRNQSDIKTVSLGSFNLKNVDEPKFIFALDDVFLSVPKPAELPKRDITSRKKTNWIAVLAIAIIVILSGYIIIHFFQKGAASTILADKSIAVLPFENLSNDPEQVYFSDGITEDIINHLAKISSLKGEIKNHY
jgi:adenylate cyclase